MGRLQTAGRDASAFGGTAHPLPSLGTSVSVPLLAGDAGTEQTVALIRQAVQAGLSNPTARAAAAEALRGVPAFNDRAAVEAIFNWVRRRIRFTQDPIGHETISSAEWTIRNGIGDCDDINAVLLPTLLMVVGHDVRLVTVTDNPHDPGGEFTHIYCEVGLDGRWIPLDAARPGASFGTTVDRVFRKWVWSLTEDSHQDLQGPRGLNGVTVGRRCNGCRGAYRNSAGMGFSWGGLMDAISGGADAAAKVIGSFRSPGSTLPIYSQSNQPGPQSAAAPSSGMNPALLIGAAALGVALLSKK